MRLATTVITRYPYVQTHFTPQFEERPLYLSVCCYLSGKLFFRAFFRRLLLLLCDVFAPRHCEGLTFNPQRLGASCQFGSIYWTLDRVFCRFHHCVNNCFSVRRFPSSWRAANMARPSVRALEILEDCQSLFEVEYGNSSLRGQGSNYFNFDSTRKDFILPYWGRIPVGFRSNLQNSDKPRYPC
jgi:hypothetical protein